MTTVAASSSTRVGLACNEGARSCIADSDIARLEERAEFTYKAFSVASGHSAPAPRDPGAEAELASFAAELDVLLVWDGAPFVSAAVLEAAARLSLCGELEGDRFAYRLDLEAAQRRGIRVVDTSHGSSLPAAEWALGLALVGLRNAGANFRKMISHQNAFYAISQRGGAGFDGAELSRKRVGLIGFGYLGRRLMDLLRPFQVEAWVFDPFVPRELAESYEIEFTSLQKVLECDVVFVLLPQTASTEGMLGSDELERLRPGSVFVNVSRGKIVDSVALLARLRRGDLVACLDVFDPEPLPTDSPLLDLENVFVSPHIGGVTAESRRRFFSLMVDECLRHFDGLEPRSQLTTGIVSLREQRTELPSSRLPEFK